MHSVRSCRTHLSSSHPHLHKSKGSAVQPEELRQATHSEAGVPVMLVATLVMSAPVTAKPIKKGRLHPSAVSVLYKLFARPVNSQVRLRTSSSGAGGQSSLLPLSRQGGEGILPSRYAPQRDRAILSGATTDYAVPVGLPLVSTRAYRRCLCKYQLKCMSQRLCRRRAIAQTWCRS